MTCRAPIADMLFAMKEIGGLAEITALPGNEEASGDLIEIVTGSTTVLALDEALF